MTTALHVLSVFVADDGAGGNPLGVFLDGQAIPTRERQAAAAQLGFSETVFVDDAATGELAIFTPATELPFAGHPLVGTAWLLARNGVAPPALRPPAGEVSTRHDDERTFIAGRPEWAPAFEHVQLDSPGDVDALPGPPPGHDLAGCWAWEDEAAGVVRARVFAVSLGVEEDEATGSHALRLAAALARPLVIQQGRGSTILARPLADGRVEIGGRVNLLERREWPQR
jgi:predicted PhzF superfamily epimerase YddE/YHI9